MNTMNMYVPIMYIRCTSWSTVPLSGLVIAVVALYPLSRILIVGQVAVCILVKTQYLL